MASFRLKRTSEGPSESRADKVVLLEATSRQILKSTTDEDPLGNLFQCFTHYLHSEEKYQLMGKAHKHRPVLSVPQVKPTKNHLMKKNLLPIHKFSGISGLCIIGTGKWRFQPKIYKMSCSSQLFNGICPVCSFTETPSMPWGSRDHLLSNTGQTISDQECRAHQTQCRYILTPNWNYSPFLGRVKCGVSDGLWPSFPGKKLWKGSNVTWSHWRPWREHSAGPHEPAWFVQKTQDLAHATSVSKLPGPQYSATSPTLSGSVNRAPYNMLLQTR